MKGFQNITSFFNETYEYAFSPVPSEKRKATAKLALILFGFALSTSGITIGVQLGSAMPFWNAIAASLTGNVVLCIIATFWGMAGYESGYTSVNLIQKILGGKVASVFSVLIILAMIIWVGINGEWLANIFIVLFPSWPFPAVITTLFILSISIFLACNGWKGMVIVSGIAVPIIIVLTIYNIIHLGTIKGGFGFLLHGQPETQLSFGAACTLIVGNFCMSATTMPDICRFAKSRRSVILCVLAYAAALILGNLYGIFIARAMDAQNLTYGILLLQMAIPSIIWLALCSYTTQIVNLYNGSLALQSLVKRTFLGGNLSHKTVVFFMGGLAILVGVARMSNYLSHFTRSLVLSVMLLAGLAIAEMLLRKKLEPPKSTIPFIAWLSGIAGGCLIWYLKGLQIWTIPVIPTVIFYILLRIRYVK